MKSLEGSDTYNLGKSQQNMSGNDEFKCKWQLDRGKKLRP